jgi:hypothetical protein
MAGFLYYIPDGTREKVTLAALREAGLGYAFERNPTPAMVSRGPDGRAGCVLADPQRVPAGEIGYYPDRQTWRQAAGYWVGMLSSSPPGPKDLARVKMLADRAWPVQLADDREWLIPVARAIHEEESGRLIHYPSLPHCVGVNEDGRWAVRGVKPAFRKLWDVAVRYWDSRWGAQTVSAGTDESGEARAEDPADENGDGARLSVAFDFVGLFDAALLALATNYRVGPHEVDLLGLFDTDSARRIMDAVVDWPFLEEWFKKKAPTDPAEG